MSTSIVTQIKSKLLRGLVALQLCLLVVVNPASVFAAMPANPILDREAPVLSDPTYLEAVQRAAAMTSDPQAQQLVAAHGLNLVNLTWEDTGRYKNSAVGPNISDVTIQVMTMDARTEKTQLHLMPVIRYPNFSDLTADISPDRFFLLVGNQQGEALHKVNLRQYLGNFRSYLHDPHSWAGDENSLLAERDSRVLVSAQAAFLPVPPQGKAEFNPVIFNYQSYQGDPAVLVIVVTREGSSATIIDNVRDAFPAGFSWGQRLFYNQDGERASFTGVRLSDFFEPSSTPDGDDAGSGTSPQAAGESGLNMVLVIQVPLKQKNPMPRNMEAGVMFSAAPEAVMKSDVEEAVIGHGEVEGPYTEVDGLEIERDERFPVRVTVQFYKATSNGIISEADVQQIASQIQRVYADGDYVGSLVVDGESGRPTEYDGSKVEPADWWQDFWQRFQNNTGLNQQQAIELWQKLKINTGRWFDWRK